MSNRNSPSNMDLETFLNGLIQKMFPAWYAAQAAKEAHLGNIGILNPHSYLSHRWLSLHAVASAAQQSLAGQGEEWKPLCGFLEKLITEREFNRTLSVSAIDGVENSAHDEDWPNLYSWAEHVGKDVPHDTAEDFDRLLHEAFPAADKPHRMVYREWDGRYYWINKGDSAAFAGLILYAHDKQRDANINALINVESINNKVLDRIHSEFWVLLMTRDSATAIHELLQRAELPAVIADFEWRRSDLAFLIARKNNRKLNQIFLNLLNKRSGQHVLEFGRWLGRHHFPFRNH
ncbi:MAG: hypothetical protein CMH98_14580 [Oceanospirillaceae bacterium]|nr:hypothetical protein [Oceanospirillaceae bacterium]|tara:strand:- start:12821 stop:13690 length:870 start_codon:yes stop_codon:yes gene_type:complete